MLRGIISLPTPTPLTELTPPTVAPRLRRSWSFFVTFQVSNIDIMTFETSCNVATNTRAWNKRTQGWLERYVYMRTGKQSPHDLAWFSKTVSPVPPNRFSRALLNVGIGDRRRQPTCHVLLTCST